MSQESVNRAAAMMVPIMEWAEQMARKLIDRLEASGDTADFRAAQEMKAKANEIEAEAARYRRQYPHIFSDT